ncbi:hypothetical protein [Endozoicomonas atrinae]|uniref:hypothetical protein n=1 Tax=Endozoicomonas atrinae TaxID=1333660 RepID=UPI003B00E342
MMDVSSVSELTHSQRLPRWRLVLFSLGHFGATLTAFSMGIVLSYFYFPPVVEGKAEIPELLPRIPLWLFSNSRLLNYPLLKKLVIASIDHEYRPNFRSHQ